MALANRDDFLKPVPRKDERRPIEGVGEVRIIELSFSDVSKLTLWMFPGGTESKKRREAYGLKMATECLVDEQGVKLFDFPDTKEGNKAFFEFAQPINEGGAGHWAEIISAVREVNAGEEVDEESLLGK